METQRLQLREMTLADLPSLAAVLQDERVMYAYEGAFSDAETALWMQKQFRRYQEYGFGLWAVVLKDTREMIGQCGITLQEYKGKQVPEIGYLLAHGHWHRGYAAEAAVACREYGFNTLNFNALYSIIRDTNVSSQQVALRNGMTLVTPLSSSTAGSGCPIGSIVFKRADEACPQVLRSEGAETAFSACLCPCLYVSFVSLHDRNMMSV